MSYSIEAIKAKLLAQQNKVNTNNKPRQKLSFYKPEVGEHDIRFLPYEDKDKQPVQEVIYYTNLIEDERFIAGYQFGLEDPINQLRTKLLEETDYSKKSLLTYLKEKSRIYAVILDRGQEDKGPQVWEISPALRDALYGILAHKDYADEAMFDPDTGYDFTLSVQPEVGPDGKAKLFKGKAVKKFTLTPRRKPSKLASKADTQKKILDAMPDLRGYFTAQVKKPEDMMNLLTTRISQLEGDSGSSDSDDAGSSSRGSSAKESGDMATSLVDDAFSGV